MDWIFRYPKYLSRQIPIQHFKIRRRTFNQCATGQWMGFFIAIAFAIIAWDLAEEGQPRVASILGGIDLVVPVTVFISGKISDESKE